MKPVLKGKKTLFKARRNIGFVTILRGRVKNRKKLISKLIKSKTTWVCKFLRFGKCTGKAESVKDSSPSNPQFGSKISHFIKGVMDKLDYIVCEEQLLN